MDRGRSLNPDKAAKKQMLMAEKDIQRQPGVIHPMRDENQNRIYLRLQASHALAAMAVQLYSSSG